MWNETILCKDDDDDDDDDDAKEIRQTVHTPRAEQHNCEKKNYCFIIIIIILYKSPPKKVEVTKRKRKTGR